MLGASEFVYGPLGHYPGDPFVNPGIVVNDSAGMMRELGSDWRDLRDIEHQLADV